MACHNYEMHEPILVTFGRNIAEKVGNEKML